jgi:hypothetical protein
VALGKEQTLPHVPQLFGLDDSAMQTPEQKLCPFGQEEEKLAQAVALVKLGPGAWTN